MLLLVVFNLFDDNKGLKEFKKGSKYNIVYCIVFILRLSWENEYVVMDEYLLMFKFFIFKYMLYVCNVLLYYVFVYIVCCNLLCCIVFDEFGFFIYFLCILIDEVMLKLNLKYLILWILMICFIYLVNNEFLVSWLKKKWGIDFMIGIIYFCLEIFDV